MDTNVARKLERTNISEELLGSVCIEAEGKYKKVKSVFCPYFRQEVKFNSKGWDHIKYKEWKKPRGRKDQYVRFKFLSLVPRILGVAATLQGFTVVEKVIRKKIFGSWNDVFNAVRYYEFVCVHKEKVRIKIIVRKDGKGDLYFYSVIPFWKMLDGKRVLFEGNPEVD